MTTIPQVAQSLQVILTDTARRLGRESGFVQRQSKFGGAELVQTLVWGWLDNPQATLEELVQSAAVVGVRLSAQGLDQRLGETAARCVQQVLLAAVQQVIQAQPVAQRVWQPFVGVYLHDSTTISLPAALAADWPGCGGGHSASDGAAALKIQVQWEWQSGRLAGLRLQAGRQSDHDAEDWLAELPAGALGLADLGYFGLERLQTQSQRGSFWLSRLQANTQLIDAQGQTWRLCDWLARQSASQLDVPMRLGTHYQLACRLLAVRVPTPVAAERRRKLRADARRRVKPVSAERLALADWNILVTNASVEQLDLAAAAVLARVRWQIELLFKLWKSHARMDQWRSRRPWRNLCEVYAKLLGQVVQHWLILLGGWDCLERSLVKAAQTIRKYVIQLASALADRPALAAALTIVQSRLAHGCRINKRRAAPSTAQLLAAFEPLPGLA